MSGELAAISSRLTSAQSQLLERSRILSLGLVPSSSSTTSLVRTLTNVRKDLAKLDDEAALERTGLMVGRTKSPVKSSAADQAALEELGDRYDRLVEMLQVDDDGRERAKALVRERRAPSPEPEPEPETSVPDLTVSPPTPGKDLKPFRDYDEDEEDDSGSHHEILQQQQSLMDDQDERLNLLSHSINRQNHLSVQIGDELDIHHELLEDTDAAMDRTANRLGRARRRLDNVADNAKQHGSTLTIVGLIVVLLLLIIVFKT